MYRKFTADYIFTGHDLLPASSVLITDQSGVIIDIIDQKDSGGGVEVFNGLLTPGFTNAHCHLELSHLKGVVPQSTGLVAFVQQVMSSRVSSVESKMEAMINAEVEMYKNGIVAVGDICNTTDSIPIKQRSRLLWHNFIEVSGFTDEAAQKRLDDMKQVHQQFRASLPEQVSTLSPHAPYSVSKMLFQLLNDETGSRVITIHNQECKAENNLYQYKSGGFLTLYKNFGIDISSFEATGKSSFQSWMPLFTNGQSIISVHNTFTGGEDVSFTGCQSTITNSQLFYCLCVNANKYIEQNIPPIGLLMNSQCDIILGTDSYASNGQLNILEEIKAIQQETKIPLIVLLQWATINGAKALQLDHIAGSFEKGKKPGIVLIEGLNDLQTTPQSFSRRIL